MFGKSTFAEFYNLDRGVDQSVAITVGENEIGLQSFVRCYVDMEITVVGAQ